MPAVARCLHGPIFDLDAVLLAAALEGLRMELEAIVHVHAARQACNGPGQRDGPRGEPLLFAEHGVRKSKRRARRRRRVERNQKAGHGACVHIERERQPGTADRPARDIVHDDQVHRRVVDLQHVQRPGSHQAPRHGTKPPFGRVAALPSGDDLGGGPRLHAPAHGPEAGRLEVRLAALVLHGIEQRGAGQLLLGEIEPVDTALDQRNHIGCKAAHALRHSAADRHQAGGARIGAVAPQGFVELALAKAKCGAGVRDPRTGKPAAGRCERAHDSLSAACLLPVRLGYGRQRPWPLTHAGHVAPQLFRFIEGLFRSIRLLSGAMGN